MVLQPGVDCHIEYSLCKFCLSLPQLWEDKEAKQKLSKINSKVCTEYN